MSAVRRGGLALWRRAEALFDRAFTPAANPLRHLGALAVLMFAVLALTGVYLFALLDTSAAGAYQSIDAVSRAQPWGGGAIRSLHRYAADGFVLVIVLHLIREWLHGHHLGVRRYAWLTGAPLLILAYVSGVGGFWLHWDQLGQFSAIATAEQLDALALFGAPFTRNFLGVDAVNDRLFSLFVFVHLGVALIALLGLWFHVQRLARPFVFAPRALVIGVCAALLVLAFAAPVTGQGAANLAVAPAALRLDWVLLFAHPLMYATSPAFVWALFAIALVALFGAPFVSRERAPVARVDEENCSGCGYCFEDCPYAAITLVSASSARRATQLAQVDPDLCAGCAVCVGACPSATPFRSMMTLAPGVDMPNAPIDGLREALERGLASLHGRRRIAVFGCDQGALAARFAAPDVAVLSLICIGMLPPSFIEYALRNGATDVIVAGCGEGACEFRLGQRWLEQRLRGEREPHLRAHVDRARVRLASAPAGDSSALADALAAARSAA